MIKNIVKRDGRVVSYDDGKIVRAIQKAMDAAGHTAKAGEAAIIAAAASAIFREACPGAELSVLSGGQPVYYYIISVE